MFNFLSSLSAAKPLLVGHRGRPALFPENTMKSWKAANQLDWVDGVETDIWCTKDKKCYCIHDQTVARTVTGWIKSKPAVDKLPADFNDSSNTKPDSYEKALENIKDKPINTLQSGSLELLVFGDGETLSTLEDYLAVCTISNKRCIVELKAQTDGVTDDNVNEMDDYVSGEYTDLISDIVKKKAWEGMQDQVIFISFAFNALSSLQTKLSGVTKLKDPTMLYLVDYLGQSPDPYFPNHPFIVPTKKNIKDFIWPAAKPLKFGLEADSKMWDDITDLMKTVQDNELWTGIYVIIDNDADYEQNRLPSEKWLGDFSPDEHTKIMNSGHNVLTSNIPIWADQVWSTKHDSSSMTSYAVAIGAAILSTIL